MPLPSFYSVGTASVAANGVAVTGQGTSWLNTVQPGDLFGTHKGAGVRILSVNSNTSLTLAYPWPAAAQDAAAYEIQITPDVARMDKTTRDILELLQSGNLEALAALDSAADRMPYFTGAGTAALAVLTAFARETLALGDAAAWRAKIGAFSTGGGTISGAVTINSELNVFGTSYNNSGTSVINGPAGGSKRIIITSGGVNRWYLGTALDSEPGGNQGSDLVIDRFSDAGSWLGSSLAIERKTGIVTTPQTPMFGVTYGGGNVTLSAGQAVGLAHVGAGFDYMRGGCSFGGDPGAGGKVVHVPVSGVYRVTLSMVVNPTTNGGVALMVDNSVAALTINVPATGWSTLSATAVLFIAQNSYLNVRCTYGTVALEMSSLKTTVELVGR